MRTGLGRGGGGGWLAEGRPVCCCAEDGVDVTVGRDVATDVVGDSGIGIGKGGGGSCERRAS